MTKIIFEASLFAILFFCHSAVASEVVNNFEKKAWAEVGYKFSYLDQEFRFSPEECKSILWNRVPCLMALNDLARRLPEPKAIALWLSNGRKSILYELLPLKLPPDLDKAALVDLKNRTRGRFERFISQLDANESNFENKEFWMDNLRSLVFKAAKSFPKEDSSQMAGETYNAYLSEIDDPHSAILPLALVFGNNKAHSGIGSGVLRLESSLSSGLEVYEGGLSVSPFKDSPAYRSGLREGDVIFEVDGEDITDLSVTEGAEKFLGPDGTKVTVKYHSLCEQKIKSAEITRRKVKRETNLLKNSRFVTLQENDINIFPGESLGLIGANCQTVNENINLKGTAQALYIPIYQFDYKGICKDFKVALKNDLANPDSSGLIIDLRGNGGGILKETNCMLDALIRSEGKIIESFLVVPNPPYGKSVPENPIQDFQADFTKKGSISTFEWEELKERQLPVKLSMSQETFTYNKNIVVLVDHETASASELFAGTIQDKKRGWVVGRRTFGKGTVQIRKERRVSKSSLAVASPNAFVHKETYSIYVLASGRSPQGSGITPDFIFKRNGDIEAFEESASQTLGEGSLYNSIQFDGGSSWSQSRPQAVARMKACISKNSKAVSKIFLKNFTENPEYFNRVRSESFQLPFARDLLGCMAPRTDMLPTVHH